jgi:hypothetical protein
VTRVPPLATRARRAVALLLHLLLTVAAPLAEAQAQGGDVEVHLESGSTSTCPPAHNHLLCPTCRHIEARFTPLSSEPCPLQDDPIFVAEPAAQAADRLDPILGRALGPRAPPLD